MNKLNKKHMFWIGYLLATAMAFGGYKMTGDQVQKVGTWLSNVKAESVFK